MRRDLRKFGAGRESSFVYHRAKRTLLPLMVSPWVIYLSLPLTVNPICPTAMRCSAWMDGCSHGCDFQKNTFDCTLSTQSGRSQP